jgi:hypothetical protein
LLKPTSALEQLYSGVFLTSFIFRPRFPAVSACIVVLRVILVLLPAFAREKTRENEHRFYP